MKTITWLATSVILILASILARGIWANVIFSLGAWGLIISLFVFARVPINSFRETLSDVSAKLLGYLILALGIPVFFQGFLLMVIEPFATMGASDVVRLALGVSLLFLGFSLVAIAIGFVYPLPPISEEIVAEISYTVKIRSVEVVPGENMVRVWLDCSLLDLNDELKEKVDKEARRYADKNLVGDNLTEDYILSYAYSGGSDELSLV